MHLLVKQFNLLFFLVWGKGKGMSTGIGIHRNLEKSTKTVLANTRIIRDSANENELCSLVVVAHAFNLSIQDAETGKSNPILIYRARSRMARATQRNSVLNLPSPQKRKLTYNLLKKSTVYKKK